MSLVVATKGRYIPYALPDHLKKVQLTNKLNSTTEASISIESKTHEKSSKYQSNYQPVDKKDEDRKQRIFFKNSLVKELMTKDVHKVQVQDTAEKAKSFMEKFNIRHLPIMEKNILVGLISDRDLLKNEKSLQKLAEFKKDVFIIRDTTAISLAAKIMEYEKINCLPVINETDNLVGILTTSDILFFVSKLAEPDQFS